MVNFLLIGWVVGWVDTRVSDFLQGTYDDLLYISRRLALELTDSGAVEYSARFDANNDGWYDLISADWAGPYLRVWLGSSTGYDSANKLIYSISAGGDCDMADLNIDGYTELIHSGYQMGSFYIYWGTPAGPSAINPTILPNGNNGEAVYVADLDKDTYLDIVIGGANPKIYIYWGSGVGYSASNKLEIPTSAHYFAHNIEVADLDKNGWLDIIAPAVASPYNYILILYCDTARIYTPFVLPYANFHYAHGLSIADLNKDGWIDIVATGYGNITFSSIFWGSVTGYSSSDKLDLHPGRCYGGSAIQDFNNDGWLEILYFRGGGGPNPGDTSKPLLYYNTSVFPYFTDSDTLAIGNFKLNASGEVVADFDKDNDLDIFINNCGISQASYVFYGPSFSEYTKLSLPSDHHGIFHEPGNLYDRSPCAWYFSRVFHNSAPIDSGKVSWIAYEPGSSRVEIEVRTGNTPIPDTSWTSWVEIDSSGASLPVTVLGHTYLQYRAGLWFDNPAQLPWLERVEINVSPVQVEEKKVQDVDFSINVPIIIWGRILQMRVSSGFRRVTEFRIYDISGRVCQSKRVNLVAGEQLVKWVLPELGSGIYFLHAETKRQKICLIQ